MLNIVRKIRGRLRHGLAMQEALDSLARRGLVFYPYIVFREFAEAQYRRSAEVPLLTRRLLEGDTALLAAVPGRAQDPDRIRARFRRGHIAIGAFDADQLVAYTWYDSREFGSVGQKAPGRPLAAHEAYLYDAFTTPSHRGQGVGRQLRGEVYQQLLAEGRRTLYSVSLYFNRPAQRFKRKLGATAVELRLSVNLFDRFKRDVLIRGYPDPAGAAR